MLPRRSCQVLEQAAQGSGCKNLQMWGLKSWFSVGLGSARLMVELYYLRILSQPKQFYDSTHKPCALVRAHSV